MNELQHFAYMEHETCEDIKQQLLPDLHKQNKETNKTLKFFTKIYRNNNV